MKISLFIGVVALGALGSAASAQPGTGFTITDQDTIFTQGVSPSGATGPTGAGATGAVFRVNGAAGFDHLFQNWWWYRVNGVDVREFAFANATGTVPGGNTATTTWTFANFTAALTYLVQDSGANAGRLGQAMSITNTTSAEISLALYNYTDFDLGGTAVADSAVVGPGPQTIRITDAGTFAEFECPGATAYGVTTFAGLRGTLADADIDNLNNTGLPFGPGDFTGAFQWNVILAPGETRIFGAEMRVNVAGNFGACCSPTMVCDILNPLVCAAQGGVYRGDNTVCSPNPCIVSMTGACCTSNCECVIVPETACIALQGVYRGDGTTCDPFACFPQPSCPCNFNGDDFLNSQDFFDFITAFFANEADYNCDTFVNSQDFFDFLSCFFTPPAGCS